MNDIPALVLFDSAATQSFVSLTLRKRFDAVPGELDYLLEVDISDKHLMRVPRVHWGCLLELFNEQCPIDLVPITLCESKVIVGMDCLSPNEAMIDCGL